MKYCAIYYRKSDDRKPFHFAHREWLKAVKPLTTTSFIPDFLSQKIFGRGIVGQILSFIKGLFIPSADVYILEGIASLPCVAFRKGKRIVINSDIFVKQLHKTKGIKRRYSYGGFWD